MDFREVVHVTSKVLNDSVVLYNCVRRPGYVLKFSRKKDNIYRCCRCRELGKQPCITVVNEIVVGTKNPEDDHHPDCLTVSAAVASAAAVDRDMHADKNIFGSGGWTAYCLCYYDIALWQNYHVSVRNKLTSAILWHSEI